MHIIDLYNTILHIYKQKFIIYINDLNGNMTFIYKKIKKLPTLEEIVYKFPLSKSGYTKILQDRTEIKNILMGIDNRLLIIIGPCSAWPKSAVLEYAHRLLTINESLKDLLKIIMRVYVQKPRTVMGWTGPINQPNPYTEPDICRGMYYVRDMMVKIIEMGLPIADEFLFTHSVYGIIELISWLSIGARSSEDYEHRIFASSLNFPIGIKNPTHGSLQTSVNSIFVAQSPHVIAINGYEISTVGNPYAHLVLRGSNRKSNYSLSNLNKIHKYMLNYSIQNPSIIIDTSHDNCYFKGNKNPNIQPNIIFNIINNMKHCQKLRKLIKGFMVESFLKEGNQNINNLDYNTIDLYGLSITDPCIGWEQTKSMLFSIADLLI